MSDKNCIFEKIAQEIAKSLSLKHNKEIAYKIIAQNDFCVMLGVCVEPNRFTASEFSARYFIQPLYIPISYIVLSLGDVIGEWDKTDLQNALSCIQQSYEHHLSIDDINQIIEMLNNGKLVFYGSLDNRYELLAYSYLVINRYDKAKHYLKKIVAFENNENVQWYKTQIERAKRVLQLLSNEQWKGIKEELLIWQKNTINELHLSV